MKQSNKTYTETIERTEFSDEMNRSYVDYAMSVIIGRALPDARDGLKPVQRRVLYDMADLHTFSNMPTKKSARIVGDTMGKYHPHGDSSIYDSLVVMAQDFKKRMPLVYGQGNFGSIEGDGAAAQRYTEVRLTKLGISFRDGHFHEPDRSGHESLHYQRWSMRVHTTLRSCPLINRNRYLSSPAAVFILVCRVDHIECSSNQFFLFCCIGTGGNGCNGGPGGRI